MIIPSFYIDDLIKRAISEDINYIDSATAYVIPEDSVSTARFVSKDSGVLCGIEIALRVFELLDNGVKYELFKSDGAAIEKGDIIAEITGKTQALLMGERTALNILQHMSGISSAVAAAVRLIEGSGACVADTRKTLPGLRTLEKYAVTVGGGKNHRYNLSDCAMLKDNHIDAGGGIEKTVALLRKKLGHTVKIEVETRDLKEVSEALSSGADIIMLDNMSCEQMRRATEMIAGRAVTEASGNITLDNIAEKAQTGVDILSLGALTHSVKAFDISMRIK